MATRRAIEVIDHLVTIYENPIPNLVSRHACFPGLAKMPSGDILALFPIGEAFESKMAMFVSRSSDQGQTWILEGPMYEAFNLGTGSLKPTVLSDGSLIAIGYGFYRDDPEVFVNPETGGLPGGANYISFSSDEGKTWSGPQEIPRSYPELIEIPGPCLELSNGELFATGALFQMWDGTIPSGRKGVVLRSRDKGKTWNDKTVFYKSSNGNISPYETRSCEMQAGRIVVVIWCLDEVAGKSLTNHVVVSRDYGMTWSDPIDTGVSGESPGVIYLGNDRLLTIHCQREGDEVGLYVYVADFANDKWCLLTRKKLWDRATSIHIGKVADIGKLLKFGQPSLLQLDNGDILATCWTIEDGQGRILTHRIRINLDKL